MFFQNAFTTTLILVTGYLAFDNFFAKPNEYGNTHPDEGEAKTIGNYKIISGKGGIFGHDHPILNATQTSNKISFSLQTEYGHSHDDETGVYVYDIINKTLTYNGKLCEKNGNVFKSVATGGHYHTIKIA